MSEELRKADAVTVVSRSCDNRGCAGGQVSRGSGCFQCHTRHRARRSVGVSPCCERARLQGEPLHSSKSAGTSLTLLTLTYKREWDAFLCFCKMDHHLNGLTNTNVFSYSPVHQKPKGYG